MVDKQDCSTLTYTGVAAGATGTNASVSAQLADLAGGSVSGRTVTFALSGGASVTAQTNANGVATATLPVAGTPRGATLTTSYAGAGDLTAATATTPFQVMTDPTSTSVASSTASATIGDPVTFTATVTPGVGSGPTGSVQFYVGGSSFGSPVALSNGSATSAAYTTTALGDLDVHAVYLGDTTFAGSTSPDISVYVHKPLIGTTTTETITPPTSVNGQDVTLGAHVAASDGGHPTGSVTFAEGATTIGTVPVDGSGDASLDVSSLSVGSHSIVAKYSGDDDYNATASAPGTATVGKASTTVTLSGPTGDTVSGQAVDLTASVAPSGAGSGTPTGSVQLKVDGNALGDPVQLQGGVATFPTLTSLLAGDHTIAASYTGDDGFSGSSDSLTQHVTKADTLVTVTTSPSPSAENQNVVITADVAPVAPGSGSPTGTVSFTADGDPIGAGTLHAATGGGSQATLDMADLPAGSHTIKASYAGDSAYAGGDSDGVSQTVIAGAARVPTTTSLTSSTDPSTYGQLITFKAAVTSDDGSTPTGSVQFSVDGASFGDPVPVGADGVAESASLASPDAGDHTVIAAFVPDAAYSSSGDTITQTVRDATAGVHLTSSKQHSDYGQSVGFTATVDSEQVGTGAPTGFVQFSVDGSPLGDAVALHGGSAASPSVSDLGPGAHTVTALYSGDADFAAQSDTLTQQVDQIATTTALSATPASSTYGDTVTLKATVTPASTAFGLPAGTVRFVDGGTTLGTVPVAAGDSASTATLSLSGLDAGSHSVEAVYAANGLFAGSTSSATTVTVAKRATTMTADAAAVSLLPLGLPLGQLKVTVASSLGPV
ncbi:MAG: Ig-like domain-containing protein, partial [Micrococcales bacterium]|nr:Ig-like domain-containing protein [Micrococcales bacterium]